MASIPAPANGVANGLPAAIPVAATPGVKPYKTTLDQADFLALMTAQLKNQDPTKPVDNSEYVAQLAQFSTVSGITETNNALARIADKLDALIAASQRTQLPAGAALATQAGAAGAPQSGAAEAPETIPATPAATET